MDANFVQLQWGSPLYESAVQLRDRLLRKPLGLNFSESELAAEKTQLHFGLQASENQLVAVVVIIPLTESRAKLRQMVVDDAHQKSGFGTQLVQSVEAELATRKFQCIELSARDIAVRFYERLGYKIEGERFIEVGIDHFKMTKTITL